MKFKDQFNKKQSIINSKAMLKDYGYYHQLTKMVMMPSIQSPILSDMPKAKHNRNVNEDRMINLLSKQEFAKHYCDVIDETINALDNNISQTILDESYIKRKYTNDFIIDKLGFSETWFYELKKRALFEFAITCCGMPVMDNTSGKIEYEPLIVMNSNVRSTMNG